MNQLPKDIIIINEIAELKKQNAALKSIIRKGVDYNYLDDMKCKTCDKHFVSFDENYASYDKPINILDESTERVFLYCDNCTDYYCMDCVFKTPIEIRLTHLYCPVCKHGNDCTTHLSEFTY